MHMIHNLRYIKIVKKETCKGFFKDFFSILLNIIDTSILNLYLSIKYDIYLLIILFKYYIIISKNKL